MARLSPEKLVERLVKEKPLPAVLLLGEEPYLRDECRKLLIDRFVPEAARTWAVSRYSAGRGETQAAVDQAQTMAMLSPQQVVFLEDVEAIQKLGEKNRDAAVTQLSAYLDDPAPFTMLVMEATGLDQNSVVCCLFLSTVGEALITRVIGRLSDAMKAQRPAQAGAAEGRLSAVLGDRRHIQRHARSWDATLLSISQDCNWRIAQSFANVE